MSRKFCEERGQLQYRIPPKDELKEKYEVRGVLASFSTLFFLCSIKSTSISLSLSLSADLSSSFLSFSASSNPIYMIERAQRFHTGKGRNVTAQEFESIARAILKIDSFTFGKAAIDILVVLFGVPVCALLTKRIVPGLNAISDDIVIPAATSGAVVYLAKSNKL